VIPLYGSLAKALQSIVSVAVLFVSGDALAQGVSDVSPRLEGNPRDPTGGASTTPTLLFIPAAALSAWTARVIAALDVHGPTAPDRLAIGTSLGFRPSLGGEVGLPGGFTLGAGTAWVGGDTSPTPVSEGISPFLQARYWILGSREGTGFQVGTSVMYKFVGFRGDPGEMELALSSQYRQKRYEVGLQAVVGKDFGSTDADTEVHAYALYRVVPQLGLGGAGQARTALISQPGESSYDVMGGMIASLTMAAWQLAGLGGVSTMGLDPGRVGGLGEIFATARF
jgi:hypothetical protein